MNLEVVQLIFLLFVLFQVKHFLADFCFQNNYMLLKDRAGWDFIYPLAFHCGVHMFFTLAVCLVFKPQLWWLALVDFFIHFLMDRLRSSPRYLGRFNNVHEAIFWRIFGLDQMVHHFTHIYLVWVMVSY